MPRFSVIVPAYNAAATIEMTIRSILAQTESDFELIIVDDGSTDASLEIARGFETDGRATVLSQANQGTAAARNTGIARAQAEWIAFLDNDDLWMPGYLEAMGAALDTEPEAGFAYCDAYNLDDETLRIGRVTELDSREGPPPTATHDEVLTALVDANFVMSSVTARREALAETGGFDATVRGTDDYDLWLRILLAGWTAVRAGDAPLLIQRGRQDSQSKDERMMDVNRRLVIRRVLHDERAPAETKRMSAEVIDEIDRWLDEEGKPTPRRRLAEIRSRAAQFRNRLRADRLFYEEPPADVAAAFPELRRTSS